MIQLRQYEIEKSHGRVFTQRPVDFDPRRYVSVRTYENVNVGQPISAEHFERVVRRH